MPTNEAKKLLRELNEVIYTVIPVFAYSIPLLDESIVYTANELVVDKDVGFVIPTMVITIFDPLDNYDENIPDIFIIIGDVLNTTHYELVDKVKVPTLVWTLHEVKADAER